MELIEAVPSIAIVARSYCFFTRILPLMERSSTEDKPELEVPAKELPCLTEKEECFLA